MSSFNDLSFFRDLLDSFKHPVLVADTGQIVRYANKVAEKFYPDGNKLLGRSLFDCHNQQSQQQMTEILTQMQQGLDEVLITDNEKRRIYICVQSVLPRANCSAIMSVLSHHWGDDTLISSERCPNLRVLGLSEGLLSDSEAHPV